MNEQDDKLNDPSYWRSRAEEARTQAERMPDLEERRQMLAIALGFEQLADRVTKRRARSLN